jgi:hypothetical protein
MRLFAKWTAVCDGCEGNVSVETQLQIIANTSSWELNQQDNKRKEHV